MPKACAFLRLAALGLLIAVAVSRILLAESLNPPWAMPVAVHDGQPMHWSGPTPADSIAILGLVLVAGLLWAIAQAIRPRPVVGRWALLFIGLFVVAGVVSTLAASNRAAARDHAITFSGMLLSFWLLVQLLAGKRSRQLALAAVLAAGMIFAAYALWQHYVDNPRFLSEDWPNLRASHFAANNWQPDDPAARQFEERVKSAEVKSFAVNANIAAALLGAVALACIGWAVQKFASPRAPLRMLFAAAACVAAAILLFALLLTGSRGGIAAGLVAVALFAVFCWRSKRRQGATARERRLVIAVVVAAVLAVAAIGAMAVMMPQPGPDSMWYRSGAARSILYRVQYWIGAGRAIAQSPLTGVGGGNFRDAYMQYKPAAALEDVDNPHNFLIAALVEFGPLGLVGLAGLIGWVFVSLARNGAYAAETLCRDSRLGCPPDAKRPEKVPPADNTGRSLLRSVFAVATGVAGLRTWLQWPGYGNAVVNIVLALAIAVPLAVLMLVLLVWRDRLEWPDEVAERWVRLAIGCGLAGFLLAGMIDFGLSQAGAATAFWTLAAIAVASTRGKTEVATSRPAGPRRLWIATCLACVVGWIVVTVHGYLPVRTSEQMMWEVISGKGGPLVPVAAAVEVQPGVRESVLAIVFDEAFLERALSADPWQPDVSSFMAGELMRRANLEKPTAGWRITLRQAERLLTAAHERCPADASVAIQLGHVRLRLGEQDQVSRQATLVMMADAAARVPHSVSLWQQYGEALLEAKAGGAADAFDHALAVDENIRRYDVAGLFSLSPSQRARLLDKRASTAPPGAATRSDR